MSNEMWDRLSLSKELGTADDLLQKSRVLLVGCGGLGSELALRLAGCHITHLTLIDGDRVSKANIPHSSLFLPRHVKRKKVEVVSELLQEKFPGIHISREGKFIQQCNTEVFAQHDLIICAPDNDQTRRWVNQYAVKAGKPTLFVGVSGPGAEWTGYIYLYTPGISGCFVCFASGGKHRQTQQISYDVIPETQDFEENRRRCGGDNIPVPMLAPVVGTVASYAASIAVKKLIGDSTPTYTYLDLKKPRLFALEIKPRSTCIVCGEPEEYDLTDSIDVSDTFSS